MSDDKTDIIINNSPTPIIRAGYSNMMLFILIGFTIFLNQILIDQSGFHYFIVAILICAWVLGIYCYLCAISKIHLINIKKF